MRTVGEALSEYQYFSSRASESTRFLAAAGLGFVWVLGREKLETLDFDLLLVALMLVAALTADAFHYLCTTRQLKDLMDRLGNRTRGRQTPDSRIRLPPAFLRTPDTLYWLKNALAIGAYVGLGVAIVFRLSKPSP